MNRELQRQQVKAILNELSDAAVPIAELGAKAIKEDWDEDKLAEEMLKALSPEQLSKNFDYYTDRIMGVFEAPNGSK